MEFVISRIWMETTPAIASSALWAKPSWQECIAIIYLDVLSLIASVSHCAELPVPSDPKRERERPFLE